ncbi:MAG: ABC transporter substrate-binding protein [bacterium]
MMVRKKLITVWLSAFVGFFLSGANLSAWAQQTFQQSERRIRVGELTGRVDLRDWRLLTRQGTLPVFGAGNGRPFQVVRRSSNEVLIRFLDSPNLEVYNPNTILFRFYETERALISALILDEVDTAVLESEVSALEVTKSNKHFTAQPVLPDSNTVKLLYYNHRDPILRSRSVRVALAFAINHDHVKKNFFQGKVTIARGPFDDTSPLYNSGMESYKYSPRRAIRLLNEAGWRDTDGDGILDKAGDRLALTLYYPKGLRLDESISRQIKIDLLKVGVDITPSPLSMNEINDHLFSHDFDIVLLDVSFRNSISSLVETFSANGSKNYMGYVSKAFAELLRFYRQTDKKGIRKTLIKGMQKVINQDQPVTFLYFRWWTHYLVNFEKYRNYRDLQGKIRPFEEWIIKNLETH